MDSLMDNCSFLKKDLDASKIAREMLVKEYGEKAEIIFSKWIELKS